MVIVSIINKTELPILHLLNKLVNQMPILKRILYKYSNQTTRIFKNIPIQYITPI